MEAPQSLRLIGPLFSKQGPCPYLSARLWGALSVHAVPTSTVEKGDRGGSSVADISVSGVAMKKLLELGFRRSGRSLYTPSCGSCHECVSIRVLADSFRPSRDQCRAARKNIDVDLEIGEPSYSDEKFALYASFVAKRYPHREDSTPQGYSSFFVENLGYTREFRYYVRDARRVAGPASTTTRRLIGVGIVDVLPAAASSVYFFFDPAESPRSLGTYSILREIDYCRQTGRKYLYLGFRVSGCRAMAYKANFRPHELLCPSRGWIAEESW